MELFSLLISSVLINNIILSRFLGVSSFLEASKKKGFTLGMGGALTFVIVINTLVAYLLYNFVMIPLGIEYMKTVLFMVVIVAIVKLVDLIIKKYLGSLYELLGIYLPLITTNCAVLGVAIDVVDKSYTIVESMVYSIGVSLGFVIVFYIFSTIRERLESSNVPKCFKGNPIALICAAIMAIAFTGFMGLV